MSVHRALLVEDILDEIFAFYNYMGLYGMDGKPTLASLALVCTAFREPAVRVIWRRLSSLYPLISLLPSCVRAEEGDASDIRGENESEVQLQGWDLPDACHREWDQLCKYTVHVRWLASGIGDRYGSEPYLKIKATRWGMVQRLSRGRPILPNVSGIFWQMEDDNVDALALFLSPSLTGLHIHCAIDYETAIGSKASIWGMRLKFYVDALCTDTPGLQMLTLDINDLPPAMVALPLADVAPRLPQTLKEIRLRTDSPSIDRACLVALARLPHMEYLDLHDSPLLNPGQPHPHLRAPIPRAAAVDFPHLRGLVINYNEPENALADAITSARMRFLHIKRMRFTDGAGMRRACTGFAAAFPSLETFWCDPFLWRPEEMAVPPRVLDLLEPFFGHCMRNVIVDFLGADMDDAAVDAVARAWPRLTQATLYTGSPVGLRSLVSLARHCPELDFLRVAGIDVREEDVALLPPEPPSHGLRTLYVTNGATAEACGIVFKKIFPNWSVW